MIPPFSLKVADLPATFFPMIEECWFAKNAATLTNQDSCNADANDASHCFVNLAWHDQSKKSAISLVFADRTEENLTNTTIRLTVGADCTDKDSVYVDTATVLN
jgi:hypothetical protein